MTISTTSARDEDGAEQIAYRLMDHICKAEGRAWLPAALGRGPVADREYTLSLYAACLKAVRGERAT
jgi:hypothetical protein